MEGAENHNEREHEHEHEHVFDIITSSSATNGLNSRQPASTSAVRTPAPAPPFQQSLSTAANNGQPNTTPFGWRRRSPLNSGYWILNELVMTVIRIIAAVVVLSLLRHEHPHARLFTWFIVYASGCLAFLPLLFWSYRNLQGPDQQHSSTHQGSTHRSMALIFLWVVSPAWCLVGIVWIFGGHSSSKDAPNLCRLCKLFLAIICIGYAMSFILYATIHWCRPWIISVREDLNQNSGATTESINLLPTYKFKIKNNKNGNETETETNSGGVVAAGTEKERVISGEDAVCCICLAKYANNDKLKELPCSHFFHKDCVDKWLKIDALCPLCKSKAGEISLRRSLVELAASLQRSNVLIDSMLQPNSDSR